MWIMSLLVFLLVYYFGMCTKWGYIGFGNLWAVKILGFATSMITYFQL